MYFRSDRANTLGSGPRVGLYARVSTHDQQTLPLQLSAMREHVERRGWAVALVVEDVGSGVRERPRREDLMRAFDQAAGFGSVLLAHARLAVSASRIWLSSPR